MNQVEKETELKKVIAWSFNVYAESMNVSG
jgi:hypothetical protein